MEVLGGVSGVLQVVSSVTKLAKSLNEVREKYNNVALNMTLVSSQLSSIRAALEAIAEWRQEAQDFSRPSQQLDEDLAISLNCCAILLTVIDAKLGEAGYTPGLKQKIRHLWLEDVLKEYLSNLEGQVRALQLLLTIYQCRTQTEQVQRLERQESRTIIEQVKVETASLRVDSDAVSVLSLDPSVHFDMDPILMRHPAYMKAYGRDRIQRRPVPTRIHEDSAPHDILPVRTKDKHSVAASAKDMQLEYKSGKEDSKEEKLNRRATEDQEDDTDSPSQPENNNMPPQYIDAVQKPADEKPVIEAPSVPASDLGEPFGSSLSTAKRHASDDLGLVMTATGLGQAKYDSDEGAVKVISGTDTDPIGSTAVGGPTNNVRASSLAGITHEQLNEAQHPSTSPQAPSAAIQSSGDKPRPASAGTDLYGASILIPSIKSIKDPRDSVQAKDTTDPFDDASNWSSSSEMSTNLKTEDIDDEGRDEKPIQNFTASLSGPFQWHLDDLDTAEPKQYKSAEADSDGHDYKPPPPTRAAPPTPQLSLNGHLSESDDSAARSDMDQSLPIPSSSDDLSTHWHRRSLSIGNSSGGSFDHSSTHFTASPPLQTAASSIHPTSPTSPREQAQMKLQSLQRELAEAKSRGDSRGAQQSLEKSIKIIHETYLPDKSPVTWPPIAKSPNRGSLLRLPSIANITNRAKKPQILALFNAVRNGDVPTIKDHLNQSVSVNVRSEEFETPLMQAAVHGQLQSLEILKYYGADELAVNSKGQTVLHLAISTRHMNSVLWLLEAYPSDAPSAAHQKPFRLSRSPSSIGSRFKNLREASDKEGFRPLHLAASLNLTEFLNVLVANGSDVDARSNWGGTPLHAAVYSNSVDSVRELLSLFAKLNVVDRLGMTPLHWAAKLDHIEAMEILLEAGAKPSYAANGDYPIHTGVRQGHVDVVEAFLRYGTDIEVKTSMGETMLHLATISKQLNLVEVLLQKSANANPFSRFIPSKVSITDGAIVTKESTDKTQPPCTTPLHFACFAGWYEMAATLLDHQALVNVSSNDGKSPLIYAAEADDTNLVYLLLARGAKVNATVPKTRMTAAHIASQKGNLETLQKLYQSGADIHARTINMVTPEEIAYKCPDKEKAKAMLTWYSSARNLRLMRAREQDRRHRQSTAPSLHVQNYTSVAPQQDYHAGGMQQSASAGVQDQMALIRQLSPPGHNQYFDPHYDSFPEAPPPYVAGPSAPSRLANRPGVYRPPDST